MPSLNINSFVYRYIRHIEMLGVIMRIFSFSLVSWMGADSPFLFVWAFNTVDAVILSWCAILKEDRAYTLLNVFWILVGVVGMLRASSLSFIALKATVLQWLAPFMNLLT